MQCRLITFLLIFLLSMMQLRERVKKLRNDHNHIYHLTRSEGVPSVDWGKIIDEKTVSNQDYLLQCFSLSLFTSLVLEIKSFTKESQLLIWKGVLCLYRQISTTKDLDKTCPLSRMKWKSTISFTVKWRPWLLTSVRETR